jgi:alpha-tubulin suppressor-like RCC1 family protein
MKLRNGVSLPKRIEALRNVKISDITAGDAHTLALSGSGRVFSWGNNASGQLGTLLSQLQRKAQTAYNL